MNPITAELLNYPTLESVEYDFNDLANRWRTASIQSSVGNLCVDYFTLDERLHTKMKSNVSFYEFITDFEFWYSKPGVRRMYEECASKSYVKRVYSAYKMYLGICTIFKPLQTLRLLETLPCRKALLDPTAGWGGRLVGACIRNVPEYIGIDSNTNLREPYSQLCNFLRERTHTRTRMFFMDARVFDYSSVEYDLVLTSPPYYNLEKYREMTQHATRKKWVEEFYRPVFTRIYEGLMPGGAMAVNINADLYRVFESIFGRESFRIPMDSRGRDQQYREYVYVWVKTI